MRSRRSIVPAGVLLWLIPQAAYAHGSLEGVGDFYAGLLHPVVVPAELLAIVASGLLIGRSGLSTCRRAIPTLAGAVAAGLVLASKVASVPDMTTPLTLVALVAAAVVTTGLRAPVWIAAWVASGLAMLAGLAVGLDAAPETNALFGALVSGIATLLGSTALITIVAALALRADKHWQRIAAQVAGSWITASAVLYLAHQLVTSTR